MTIAKRFTKSFFFFNLFLLNYFTFKISTNVIQIHAKTEVVAITKTDLSLVRVLLDGRGRSVKSVSLSLNGIGGRCQSNTIVISSPLEERIEKKNKN